MAEIREFDETFTELYLTLLSLCDSQSPNWSAY